MIFSTTTKNSSNMEQPGRLFNRAPVCYSSEPLQHRRKLRQVSSYYNLDDIPTFPAEPDMKGCGGVINISDDSPKCLSDFKHFDPTTFQDDIGGVPIELCTSDSDSDEEDDLFQSLREEELKQHEQQHYLELEPINGRPSPLPPVLPPILEERKVSFASQHIVMRVDDDENNCAIDQRYVHQVFDAVQVWFIPHNTDYDQEERANMWYSSAEMAAMKERAIQDKHSTERTRQRQARFEAELDTCSLFSSPQAPLDLDEDLPSSERRFRYEAMVDAVLLEQYEQRRLCLKVYGRVNEGFTGIIDTERLAKVCAIAGHTQHTTERALAKAQRTLSELNQEDKELEHKSKINGPSTPASVGGNKTYKKKKHPKLKRSPSFNSTAITVESSKLLDKGIGSVFRVLLSPVLEIRKGNLFLGIGEEMSVSV